jgi:hypothetical protein
MLACVLVVGFVALFAARPAGAVLAYAGSRPLADAYVHVHVGSLSAGELWGGGLLLVCVVYLATTSADKSVDPLLVPACFLGVFAALTLWRPQTAYALSYGLKFAAWLLVVVVVERIARSRRGQELVFTTGIVSAVLIVLVIAFAIAQNTYGSAYYAAQFSDPGARFTDVGQQPVGLSEFAVMALPLVLYGTLAGFRRNLSSLLAGAIAVVVVASFVRTTQLGLAVMLVGFGLIVLRARRARFPVIVSFAPALAATLVTIYALGTKILLRFQDIAFLVHSGTNKELAGSGRVFLWTKLVHSGLHSVTSTMIGQGAGKSVALTIHDGLNKSGAGGVWAHSDVVESFVTGGLVLVAAYLLLVGWMFLPAWRLAHDMDHSRRARALGGIGLIALVAFAVMSLASGIAYSSIATIPTALLLGLVRGLEATPGRTFVDEPEEETAGWT